MFEFWFEGGQFAGEFKLFRQELFRVAGDILEGLCLCLACRVSFARMAGLEYKPTHSQDTEFLFCELKVCS